MSDLEKKIQNAADKLTKGINKGADYLTQLSEKLDEKAAEVSEKITSSNGSFQCPSCGSSIPDDSSKLVLTCPFCGTTITKSQTTTDKVISIVKDPLKQYQERKAKEEAAAREQRRKYEEERKKHPIKSQLGMIALLFALAGGIIFGVVLPHQERIRKLEALVVEIRQDIDNGNFETARAKTNNVYLNDDVSSSANERWDRERKTLLALIDAAQKDKDSSTASSVGQDMVEESAPPLPVENDLSTEEELPKENEPVEDYSGFHAAAIQALEVALTNDLAEDIYSPDGSYIESKFHDASYNGAYKVSLHADGNWEFIDENHANVENIYLYNSTDDQMIKVTVSVEFSNDVFMFNGQMIKAKPKYIDSKAGSKDFDSKTTGWTSIDPETYDQPYFIVPVKLLLISYP